MVHNDRARARFDGFSIGLTARGLHPFRDAILEKPYSIEGGREALTELVNGDRLPSALVCGNDVLALGVLLEAQRRGLDVPQDLSIVGFDDLPLARHFRPSLTTIAMPVGEAGRRAGTSLVASIEGARPVESVCLDAPLFARGSTGVLRQAIRTGSKSKRSGG